MAQQPTKPASGNTTNKTTPGPQPAPTRPPEFEKDFTYGRQSYGSNAYGGASSDLPGTRTRADMSVNNDDNDPVLASVRQNGTKLDTNITDQLRNINAGNKTPVTYGHKDPNAGNPKIG